MPPFDFLEFANTMRFLPDTALALLKPDGVATPGEEYVVHRDELTQTDAIFLFEAPDDAYDCAQEAAAALGYIPAVRRVRIAELEFCRARYKTAGDPMEDVELPAAHRQQR